MKSIAIISSQAFSLVNFRGRLIHDLVQRGVKVYALAPDYDSQRLQQIEQLGAIPIKIRFNRTGVNPFVDLFNMMRLAMVLKKLKPDVTLAYFIKPVVYGMISAWIVGVPRRIALIEGLGYIFTLQKGSISWRRRVFRSITIQLYRFSLGRADKAIFLNHDDISELVAFGAVNSSKTVHVGGIGVDFEMWPLSPIVYKPITFLMVSRLLLEKGVNEYVQAARTVKKSSPDVQFLLVGGLDSNPGGLLESDVRAWVDEGVIVWAGHVDDVASWIAKASVFVLPSYREGLPRSTQEAMAMGRAIITTDVPGCRDTVVDGFNGFKVPARNASALANAMTRFIHQPDLIGVMGKNSHRMAVKQFDVNVINEQFINVFEGH